MKIVILDGYGLNPGDLSWEALERLGNVTVYDRTPVIDADEIVRRIDSAEIVLTNKTPLSAATLARCEGLKYVGVLATGYNVVDITAARELGITVCNIPAYSTAATAQFAIALLLEVCHHIGAHSAAVHAGAWCESKDFCFWNYPLIELSGKTLGIIGYGSIGRTVGKIAAAMGMNVIANSRTPWSDGSAEAKYVSLDELLSLSDVVTLHCPLFPETKGLINKDSIAKMKNGAILINNSRGPVIVEQDVADALNAGKLAAAAVDVASVEPMREDNPLLSAKNCIITPHISWAPLETRQRLLDIAVANVTAFMDGKPVNVVND